MILKLIGCILIVGSSTIMGYTIANKYAKRPEELRALQAALQMLESEIIFSVNPLPDAFERISKYVPKNIHKLFAHSAYLLKQRTGITAQEAWSISVHQTREEMHLEKEDREILISFGNSLGCSDREQQLKNIHLACSKLALEEKKAEKLREKNEKLYKNLGVLGGILVALIFI
ncbi:MAG: stage sporulation protein [Clostridiales bacterium]|jgi:stage III sporulation protein AB|nr:stage sporulation protein [Clostridiales bacterium]MDK2934495.1 stage sporulation protein [Clostridiales bacterium]